MFYFLPVFQRIAPEHFPDTLSPEVQIVCPFHGDQVPSCRVNVQTGLWKCFGCQKAGTVETFVSLYTNCSLGEAGAKIEVWLGRPKQTALPTRKRSRIHAKSMSLSTGWLLSAVETHRADPEVRRLVKHRDLEHLITYLQAKEPPNVLQTTAVRVRGTTLSALGSPEWWTAVNQVVSTLVQRPEIPEDMVRYYEEGLTASVALPLMRRRGWTRTTLRAFRIGWDAASQRYTFPVYVDGVCVNLRKYQPGAPADKMISYALDYGTPRFYPHDRMKDAADVVWLEGEPDTVLAHQLGLPALTVTGGAGTVPVGALAYLAGKRVTLCFDCDEAGRTGMAAVAKRIRPFVRQVTTVDLGLPYRGGDFTDFILREGQTVDVFMALPRKEA